MDRLRTALWGSIAFVFLMITSGSAPALAGTAEGTSEKPLKQTQRRHWGMGPEAPWISIMLRHRSELNLTQEQVAALEKLRSDLQGQVAPLRTDLRNTEGEIARLLQQERVDLTEVKAKLEGAEKLRAKFRYLRIEALEGGKSVLTAEQRDQLKNLVPSGHGRFRRPHGESS